MLVQDTVVGQDGEYGAVWCSMVQYGAVREHCVAVSSARLNTMYVYMS